MTSLSEEDNTDRRSVGLKFKLKTDKVLDHRPIPERHPAIL